MTTPHRIQRQRTKGWRMPDGAVYVGRGSKWGNRFKVGSWVRFSPERLPSQLTTRAQVAAMFRIEAETHPTFRENVKRELRGKDLACWCPLNQPCHADVLLEIANA